MRRLIAGAMMTTVIVAAAACSGGGHDSRGSEPKQPPAFRLQDLPTTYAMDDVSASEEKADPLSFCRGLPSIQRYGERVALEEFKGASASEWLRFTVLRATDARLYGDLAQSLAGCTGSSDVSTDGSVTVIVKNDVAVVSGPAVGDASTWWDTVTSIESTVEVGVDAPATKHSALVKAGPYVIIASAGPSATQTELARYIANALRSS